MDKQLEEYFPLEIQRKTVLSPFQKLGGHGRYDHDHPRKRRRH